MLIKKKSYFLDKVEHKKDKTHFVHRQFVGHIQESVGVLKKHTDGWTKGKTMKHFARIPTVLFLKVQHIIAPGGAIDSRALQKWLNTAEGAPYKVSNA